MVGRVAPVWDSIFNITFQLYSKGLGFILAPLGHNSLFVHPFLINKFIRYEPAHAISNNVAFCHV